MLSEPVFSLVIGLGCAIFSFAAQVLICLMTKKTALRLIPVYIIVAGIVLCIAVYSGMFGTGNGFIGDGYKILALILSMIIGLACIGVVSAWIVYTVLKMRNR